MLKRFGLVVVEALRKLAADFLNKFKVFLGFKTFYERVDTELFSNANQFSENYSVHSAVIIEMFKQFHIVLNQIKFEMTEYIYTRITAAKVVKPKPVTVFANLSKLSNHFVFANSQVLLCYFNDEVAFIYVS